MTTPREQAVEAVRATLAEHGAAAPNRDTDSLAELVVSAVERELGDTDTNAEAVEIAAPHGDAESDEAEAEGHDVADGTEPVPGAGTE